MVKKIGLFHLITTSIATFSLGFALGVLYVYNKFMNFIADFFKDHGVGQAQELLYEMIRYGMARGGIA